MYNAKYTKPKVDELKLSWDDDFCNLDHKKYHEKKLPRDINYHMTVHILFSVVAWRHTQ